jgi:hypothetical protein
MVFSWYRERLSDETIKGFLYRFAILFLIIALISTLGYGIYIFNNQKIQTIIVDTSRDQKLSDVERMEEFAAHLLSLVTYLTPSNCERRANKYLEYVTPEAFNSAALELRDTCSYLNNSKVSIVYDFNIKPEKKNIEENSVTFIYKGNYVVLGAARGISDEVKMFSIKIIKKKGGIYADTIKPYDPNAVS